MPRPFHHRRATIAATLFVLLSVFSACSKTQTSDNPPASGGRTVLEIIQNSFSVSLFSAALSYTGLADSLKGAGPYTIFVPSNAAFDSIGIHTVAQIDTMDKARLTHLLKYHILYGRQVRLQDVDQKPNNPFVSWDNLTLYISRPYDNTNYNNTDLSTFLTVNADTVVEENIIATNGVVHSLKNVLKYQSFATCADLLSADTNYSYFVTALKNFNLYSQLQSPGPVTVFAPLNSAFTAAGIDQDSLSRMDTLHFIKLLFAPYICPGLRFFTTDLIDFTAPFKYYPPGNGYADSLFVSNYTPYIQTGGLDPVNHDPIPLANFTYYSGLIPPALVDIDRPTGNGVVQGINGLMAWPSYCTIHQ